MNSSINNKALWPGWETVRLIGRGSFGAVYEIRRTAYGHEENAAVKMISIPQQASDVDEMRDSGYDEASITATFKSHLESIVNEYSLMREMNGAANVVNCDDFRVVQHDDSIGWDIFIKMELLTPITKALPMTPDEAQVIQVGKDLCHALILCKKHNIIHRDIKPQNIFVSNNGDYKLGDFGIAKMVERTSGGTKIGTYKYMAPEVYNNKPYNQAADIYSLGLVLHWMLNERRAPFLPLPPAPALARDEDQARLRRFQGEPIPAPAHGSRELQRIVLKACAYDLKDRYQNPEDMLSDLVRLGKRDASVVIPPVINSAGDDETDAGTTGEYTDGKTEKGTVDVWHKNKTRQEERNAEDIPDRDERKDGTKTNYYGTKDRTEKEKTVSVPFVQKPVKRKSSKKWIAIAAAAVLLLAVLAAAAVPLTKTQIAEIMPDESTLRDFLRDDYSAIGCFDVKTTLKLSANKKIYFPVSNVYDGNTVIISSVDQPETEGLQAVVENGMVEAEVDPDGRYLLLVKIDDEPEDVWTAWSDTLPEDFDYENGDYEAAVVYRAREKEFDVSNESEMPGWEQYDMTEGKTEYGAWSAWETTPQQSSQDIETEQQLCYRYREKETMSSDKKTVDGWTLYDTKTAWSDYGAWSGWTTTAVSQSDTVDVQTKTQYSYRDIQEVYSDTQLSNSAYTLIEIGYSYGAWSDWQDSEISSSSTLEVQTREVETGKKYLMYHYCTGNVSGAQWCTAASNSTSNTVFNENCVYHGLGWYDSLDSFTPRDSGGYIGPTCSNSCWTWYIGDTVTISKTQYRCREVQVTYIYEYRGSWSAWSDTAYTSSASREVRSRTVYRSRSRTPIYTYYFYKWSDWSGWSTEEVKKSSDIEVESQTLYRYRKVYDGSVYYYYRWKDWSDWDYSRIEESEDTEIESKVVYRYII